MELDNKTLVYDRGGIEVENCNSTRFTYPRIEGRFNSPLLNDRNYELSGGGPWLQVIGRVIDGLKPVAFVDQSHPRERWLAGIERNPSSAQDMRQAARLALDANRCVLVHQRIFEDGPHVFCSASVSGRIGDIFDIPALIADYRDYTSSAGPAAGDDIDAELRAIAHRDVSDYLNFWDLEGDRGVSTGHDPSTPGDWARRGLLLGYPVETTAAIICGHLGIDGCGAENSS